MLGLCCCLDNSLVAVSGGYYLVVVRRPLIVVASLVAEHRLNSCGVGGTQLVHDMWDLPRSGIEPSSSALEGKFFTTEPPGKPNNKYLAKQNLLNSDI